MTRYSILFFLFYVVLFGGCASSNFKHISRKVEKESHKGSGKLKQLSFHEVRMRLYRELRGSFLKSNFDTLFILESYSIEDATYSSKIWNQEDSIAYKYYQGKFVFRKSDLFTTYMCSLVQNWDTLSIRKEEEMHSNMHPTNWIYASRIIKKDNNVGVDVIKFKSFFMLERDRQ